MNTKQALENFGQMVADKIIANYKARGLKASGKFEKNVKVIATSQSVKVIGPFYANILETGRGPSKKGGAAGTGQLRQAIFQWTIDKGINPTDISRESLSFLIARKIHEQGINVPNKYNSGDFATDAIKDVDPDDLIVQYSRFYLGIIRSQLERAILN